MMKFKRIYLTASVLFSLQIAFSQPDEIYRPQVHFTPKEKWMNDPNGMVYKDGVYHLFYQYHPGSSVWGPMHWGHATSKDLVHWERKSIKLFPDSIGTIFSGSAVVDINNTAGFGKDALVAVFTQHNHDGEKAGRNDFQNQSIAYSLDNGETWTKYNGNPVLKNPGIKDFRDPKVVWHQPSNKWIMTLAVVDHVSFYSSPDLKRWTRESDFGADAGAHGGVWECPDLFPMEHDGKQVWVLLVSINPGGPNKGSATQYFLGDFDGRKFSSTDKTTRWLDYGPDNYAGVTWSNTGNRKFFIGWMSNWSYAMAVPTETWRSAMTVTRELQLKKEGNKIFLTSMPVQELEKLQQNKETFASILLHNNSFDITSWVKQAKLPCRINLILSNTQGFTFTVSNKSGDQLLIGFDNARNEYFIDRTRSGKTKFSSDFPVRVTASRFSSANNAKITLVLDVSSVELFADDGLTVMTAVVFPNKPFTGIKLTATEMVGIEKLDFIFLKSIW